MKRLHALALILSALFVGAAIAEAQEMRDLYTSRDAAGGERVYRVAEDRLLATKAWSPASEPPPLPVQAAVAAAMKSLSAKRPGGVQVIEIALTASGGKDWRWFYRIELYDLATARRAQGPERLEVVVLMDGSIVEPAVAGRDEAHGR